MAKLYVIQRIGYEYNDEYYRREGGGTAVEAYRLKANADEQCRRLNEKGAADEAASRYPMEDGCGRPITDFFEVVAVEFPDMEVESYAEATKEVEKAQRADEYDHD